MGTQLSQCSNNKEDPETTLNSDNAEQLNADMGKAKEESERKESDLKEESENIQAELKVEKEATIKSEVQAAEEKAIPEEKLMADKKVESCSSKDPDSADIERLYISKKLHYQKETNDPENELNKDVNVEIGRNGDPHLAHDSDGNCDP